MVVVQSRVTPGRLTPRASSSLAKHTPGGAGRSPTKTYREGQCLALKTIIGNTVSSSSCFAGLDTKRFLAYTAGGAVVLAHVTGGLQLEERCFRATQPSAVNHAGAVLESLAPFGSPLPGRGRHHLGRDGHGQSPLCSPIPDNVDSPTFRPSNARERTKPISCVALSPDARFLASGETGHKPRILLFSTASDVRSDLPLTAITEHTFGVKHLAFSPDSQLLASLGDINDGFLHIWNIHQRTGSASLYATNKCTSYIRDMAWMGNTLVTVGTRHVKLWRIGNASPVSPSKRSATNEATVSLASPSKPLSGRNCVLGPLLHRTFAAVIALDDSKAVLSSDRGEICILEDNDASPSFRKVAEAGFAVNAISRSSHETLCVGGRGIERFNISELLSADGGDNLAKPSEEKHGDSKGVSPSILALVSIGEYVVVVDSSRRIEFLGLRKDEGSETHDMYVARRVPAHGSSIQGIQTFQSSAMLDASFITFSAEGTILFWGPTGTQIDEIQARIDQPVDFEGTHINALSAAKACQIHKKIIVGDRLGNLKIYDTSTRESIFHAKAHQGEVTDIAVHEAEEKLIIATSGKDRAVQLFEHRNGSCALVQTLEEHTGAVSGVAFSNDGKKLLSFSTDRTIVLRDAVSGNRHGQEVLAYVLNRTINVKATPLSVAMYPDFPGTFLVSTADKRVFRYAIYCGSVIDSFKASDGDEGETVSLNTIIRVPPHQAVEGIAGIVNADKSVRMYDENGRLVGRDYGHVEGVTGIVLVDSHDSNSGRLLVTVSTDGTILMWQISSPTDQLGRALDSTESSQESSRVNDASISRPPLRKVISTSELMQLQGLLEEDRPAKGGAEAAKTPSLRRKPSNTSLSQTQTPTVGARRLGNRSEPQTDAETVDEVKNRRGTRSRGASPVSGRAPHQVDKFSRKLRRQSSFPDTSADRRMTANPSSLRTGLRRISQGNDIVRNRSGSPTRSGKGAESMNGHTSAKQSGFKDDMTVRTTQMTKALTSYRRRLNASDEVIPKDSMKDLERELAHTAKALAANAVRHSGTKLAGQLLDQYSERLVGMLDERIKGHVIETMAKIERPEEAGLDKETKKEVGVWREDAGEVQADAPKDI